MGWGNLSLYKRSQSHVKNLLLWNQKADDLEGWYVALNTQVLYQVYSNDDSGLTLAYFMAVSDLVPDAFVWEKGKTIHVDFPETIVHVVCDIKVGRCSRQNEWNLFLLEKSDILLQIRNFHLLKRYLLPVPPLNDNSFLHF